jgi:hypothetical protein
LQRTRQGNPGALSAPWQAIPAGAEACISYGCTAKSNEELMRDYGFVLAGNVNDRIPFSAGARWLLVLLDDSGNLVLQPAEFGICEDCRFQFGFIPGS